MENKVMYSSILSPFRIGSLELKNRVVFAPTTMGLPEEAYFKKIKEIAGGGVGLIIIGDVPVQKSLFGKTLDSPKGFRFYNQLAQLVHSNGAKICAQLHVPDSDVKRMIRYIPGVMAKKITGEQLRQLLNDTVSPYISKMSTEKVRRITGSFGSAAVLAEKAGFDMVQIHGDRMCGSFSSAIYNKRTDQYGGGPESRARFAVEAVRAVRKAAPHMPVDFKLAVRQEAPHYGKAGVLAEELSVFVPLLEQAGVDSFHVALANHGSLEDTIPPASHPYFSGEGCFLRFCDQVRQYTKLPLCGVGGLTDPDFVEAQLNSGRIQLTAMSRQLVADPQWVNKTAAGEVPTIKRCVRCNKKCLGGMQQHQGVSCIFDQEV